jgi:hypothetical protein
MWNIWESQHQIKMAHSNKIDWSSIWGKCACSSVQNIHFLNKNIDIEIRNSKIFPLFYHGSETREILGYRRGIWIYGALRDAGGYLLFGRVFVVSEGICCFGGPNNRKRLKQVEKQITRRFITLVFSVFYLSYQTMKTRLVWVKSSTGNLLYRSYLQIVFGHLVWNFVTAVPPLKWSNISHLPKAACKIIDFYSIRNYITKKTMSYQL